jgi:hypothetical protein
VKKSFHAHIAWTHVLSGHLGNLVFVDVAFAGLFALLGSTYNKRVILHQDAVEVASRKLNFAEIRGRKTTGGPRHAFAYAHIFIPSNNKRKLALPPYLHTDQLFQDWIKTIPKVPR